MFYRLYVHAQVYRCIMLENGASGCRSYSSPEGWIQAWGSSKTHQSSVSSRRSHQTAQWGHPHTDSCRTQSPLLLIFYCIFSAVFFNNIVNIKIIFMDTIIQNCYWIPSIILVSYNSSLRFSFLVKDITECIMYTAKLNSEQSSVRS